MKGKFILLLESLDSLLETLINPEMDLANKQDALQAFKEQKDRVLFQLLMDDSDWD